MPSPLVGLAAPSCLSHCLAVFPVDVLWVRKAPTLTSNCPSVRAWCWCLATERPVKCVVSVCPPQGCRLPVWSQDSDKSETGRRPHLMPKPRWLSLLPAAFLGQVGRGKWPLRRKRPEEASSLFGASGFIPQARAEVPTRSVPHAPRLQASSCVSPRASAPTGALPTPSGLTCRGRQELTAPAVSTLGRCDFSLS